MNTKKGQAWGFDLIVASIIFLTGIVVFYIYSLNYPSEGRENLDSLFYEGNLITENLLSKGFPNDWVSSNVKSIGISNEEKINETKLERLYDLTLAPGGYDTSKAIFNTKFDYYFNFSQLMVIDGNTVEYIGQKNINPNNLIKVTRFTIYQNKPVTLNLFVWE
jgi:hypothetical protein